MFPINHISGIIPVSNITFNQKDTPNLPEPEVQETNQINEEINKYIDKNEILNCIKKLKCNTHSFKFILHVFSMS
jgi:hypothetical protein